MCQYSDISSVEEEEENSPSSGQLKKNKNEIYDDDDDDEQDHHGDNLYNYCNCIFCSRSTIYGEQGGNNISTEPVPIQCGACLPPMHGDQQQQDYEEEEEVLGDNDDLTVNVFNFPSTYFYLKLERTKSFKHKQDEIVNEQSYIVGLMKILYEEMLHWGIYTINCIYSFIVC